MEKVIWVINNNKDEILCIQRKINSFGSMRALCMLSVDALKRTINERLELGADSLSAPSLILVDSNMLEKTDGVLKLLKDNPKLAGVPLFFIVDEGTKDLDEFYLKGAMVVINKPVSESSVVRIERAAWQYETTRNYERILQKQVSELAAAKEIQKLNEQLESRNNFLYKVFGQYFSDDVIKVILDSPRGAYVGGERRNVAVLMADLRGFSSFVDGMDADGVTKVLNCYFGTMVEIISRFGGTLIELMGDGILAVFGAPVMSDRYCDNAVAAGICMQNAMVKVNEFCEKCGYDNLEMGIGIHCGEAFVGNVGTERMMRYNVIGSTVNECARIEGCSVGGQILVSREVITNISDAAYIVDMAQILAKGIKRPINIYEIRGISGECECFLNADSSYEMYSPNQNVGIYLHPINNKIISEKCIEVKIDKFSLANCVATGEELDGLELFADVEVRSICKSQPEFAGVYAKVMGIYEDRVQLRFTHVNKEFREFADCLQEKRGVVMESGERIVVRETALSDIDCLPKVNGGECVLCFAKDGEDVRIVCVSANKSIRALEFMDYLVAEYAMINGNDMVAKAMLTKAFLGALMAECTAQDVQEFLDKKVESYYSDCDWIYGDEYLEANSDKILKMPRYVKKMMAWAYVKTTDIVPVGEKFRLKSLENESDIVITASEDLYVMIGCRGEVYCIEREKFENTYDVSDKELDVFEQMLDYLPEVRKFPEDDFISLDVKAHLCYPRVQSGIYAMEIDRRTKVFTEHNNGEYFVGRPGDFLAIRTDDLTDIYIIQHEIFYQTYEHA